MLVIGIVGGVASGKSRVAEQFAELGAQVIRADDIGHQVLLQPEVVRALQKRWGAAVLGSDGRIDRAAVARIVFASAPDGPRELKFLESVTHPQIGDEIRRLIDAYAARGDVPAVILDAALLMETGWHQYCDRIVFVDVDRRQRLQRAQGRGWTAANLAAREAAQISLEAKRKVADGVIDNSGTFDHTFHQVRQFWQSLDLIPPD